MDNRVLLAIILSIGVLIVFQYLYMKFFAPPLPQGNNTYAVNQTENYTSTKSSSESQPKLITTNLQTPTFPEKITKIKTPNFEAEITNFGVRFKSFKLLKYKKEPQR